MTGRWGVGVVVSAAVVASACSGGDGDAPAAPLEPTESIESIESIVVESSVVATTTTSPSPSTTSTTSTTEPPPPTTTLEDLRLDIEADLNEGERVLLEGAASPGDPASIEALSLYFAGPSLEATLAIYSRLVASGLTGQPGRDVESTIEVESLVFVEGDGAQILACRIDAAVTVDSSGRVVDDVPVRYRSLNSIVLENGLWKLNGGELLSSEPGETGCDV